MPLAVQLCSSLSSSANLIQVLEEGKISHVSVDTKKHFYQNVKMFYQTLSEMYLRVYLSLSNTHTTHAVSVV